MLGQETFEISLSNTTVDSDESTVVSPSYIGQAIVDDLTGYADVSFATLSSITLIKTLAELSVSTEGYVQLLPEMSYMPVLIGNDEQPVYLYQLVEILESYLDYDALLAEFPTLNFSQISGAISFLRKVAQINSRQIDVDELEDQLDTEFLDELRQAFEERGNVARVLTHAI